LWAENAAWSLRKAAFLLSFFPLFFVFFAVLRDPQPREKIFRALVSGAALVATLSFLQFFSQFIFGVEKVFDFWVRTVLPFFLGPTFGEAVASYPSLLVNISGFTVMRASGFFPDPHMAAFFFGMTLPLALALSFCDIPTRRKYWLAGACTILLADLLTFSRGGYVGLMCGSGIFFLLLLSSRMDKKSILKIIIGVLIFVSGVILSPVGTRFVSSFSQSDGSNIERLRLWQESVTFISERPLLGVGLGNYPLAVKPTANYREPIYAHNPFLDIALETGLVGLFFFLALLSSCLRSAWGKWRVEGDVFGFALLVALVVFIAHSFFETPLFSVHILPLLLLLLAASLSPSVSRKKK
jgi:O-antigen ligase